MANELKTKLEHSVATYRYAVSSLPPVHSDQSWPIRHGGFEFRSRDQVKSMLIELGWAFFCRYEACVETFLKRRGVRLTKKVSITDWLAARAAISEDRRQPLDLYRKIRNSLHHEDGNALDGGPDQEIHLLPVHMEQFYEFFLWLGDKVTELTELTELQTK